MKQISLKRQARLGAARRWREQLRSLGRCDWCLAAAGEWRDRRPIHLQVQEVARGCGPRQKALDAPFATCLLCANCHADLHRISGEMMTCIGLALIRYHRPQCYSLESFYALTGRRWPAEHLIELWTRRITVFCAEHRGLTPADR